MSEATVYQCPNCGGQVRFAIGEQALVCRHCGHEFEPGEWEVPLPVVGGGERALDHEPVETVEEFLERAP